MPTRTTAPLPCLFCGTNKQAYSSDSFLTQTKSKNGNSYDFCKRHWRKLRQVATAEVIDHYRRYRLQDRPQTIAGVLDDLAVEMKHNS